MRKRTLAARIVAEVMRDLRGRKGLMDDVEPVVQEEIEAELARKVAEQLAAEFGGQAVGEAVTL